MARSAANPWRKPILRELAGGRMIVADAARIAGVSVIRVRQWCEAAGIDPAAAWEHRLAVFYARTLLGMSKRDRLAPYMMAKASRPKRARPDKPAMRAELDAKVIDFKAAGGKVKRLPTTRPKSRL